MAIDTHMHINSMILENLNYYIDQINTNPAISNVINVGLDTKTSKEISVMSQNIKKMSHSVGIHPLYISGQKCDDLYEFINNKTVAIGEIGLDTQNDNYHEQLKYLIRQISIANELHLPVIIHANNTNQEIINTFEKFVKPLYGCVFHCFQPDIKILKYLIDNNYYISFAGRITYMNAKKSIEVVRMIPNDLILIETDSPYISPEPLRNSTNESSNIRYVIQKLSDIKELSYNEVESITAENAKRLFKRMK